MRSCLRQLPRTPYIEARRQLEKFVDILVKNISSYVKSASPDELAFVSKTLSFQPVGYQFSPKYIEGKWDGTISLLDKWRHAFPAGLTGYLATRLTKEGIKFHLMDLRSRPEGSPLDVSKTEAILRPYQVETVQTSLEVGRGILNLPTASGKTMTASVIIGKAGVNTLFVNHTKDLLYQSKEDIEKVIGEEMGVIGDGVFNPKKYTVAMIQTLYARIANKEMKDYLKGVQMLVLDEVHHTGKNSWFRVAMNIPAYYRFGLTGTATRHDGANLNLMGATGRVIAKVTSSSLVKLGYLSKPYIYVYPVDEEVPATDYHDAYDLGIVRNEYRNAKIAELAKGFVKGDQTVLILVTRIEHGNTLVGLIPGAVFLNGGVDGHVRKETLDAFRDGKVKCVIATAIFDEGVNVVSMNAVILAGGGESDIKTVQRVGRVLRPSKDKDHAIVIDFLDRSNRYLWDHSESRLACYGREEEFVVKIMEDAAEV